MDNDDKDECGPIVGSLPEGKTRGVRSTTETSAPTDSVWFQGAETSTEIAYQHTVLCQTSLPYRDPGGLWEWERVQGVVSLKVYAGEVY